MLSGVYSEFLALAEDFHKHDGDPLDIQSDEFDQKYLSLQPVFHDLEKRVGYVRTTRLHY